jgi:hypothetical protein
LDNLLQSAIEAHGGLNAWNQFESLRASVSIGMRFGNKKNSPGYLRNRAMSVNPAEILLSPYVLGDLKLKNRIVMVRFTSVSA